MLPLSIIRFFSMEQNVCAIIIINRMLIYVRSHANSATVCYLENVNCKHCVTSIESYCYIQHNWAQFATLAHRMNMKKQIIKLIEYDWWLKRTFLIENECDQDGVRK